MNRTVKIVLLAVGGVVLLAGAFVAGAWAMRGASAAAPAAQATQGSFGNRRGGGRMQGGGNMQGNGPAQQQGGMGYGEMMGENESAGEGPAAGNGYRSGSMMGDGDEHAGPMMGGGVAGGCDGMVEAYASDPNVPPMTAAEAQSARVHFIFAR